MFLEVSEMKNVIYEYQVNDITEGDDSIVAGAINAAVDEVKSYLTPNNQLEWLDGRLLYDVEAIFAAEGADRNELILYHVKNIAKRWIVQLSNVDISLEMVERAYENSVAYLTKVAKGIVTLAGVPLLQPSEDMPDAFASGSRRKFRHEEEPVLFPFNPAIDSPTFTNMRPV